MAEEDEGAIGAEGAMGAEGAEGAMGSEGVIGGEEDKGAAIYLMLDGQDTTGIGYMALWGFRAKCRSGWSGVDGYPLDCYDYQSTYGAKNHDDIIKLKSADVDQSDSLNIPFPRLGDLQPIMQLSHYQR